MLYPRTRQLFPTLPPELRNAIYAFTTSTPNPTTTSSSPPPATHGLPLPFQTKTYTTAHTTLTIAPSHTGIPALLALEKHGFLEAAEYRTWLLAHGIELRIGIVIYGNVSTFSAQHWGAKTEAQVRRLFTKYAWLGAAARWDVRVLWEADVYALRGAKAGRAGQIVDAVVGSVLRCADPTVLRKRGNVRVRLQVPCAYAVAKMVDGGEFGVERFLGGAGSGARREVREVDSVEGGCGRREKAMLTTRLQKVDEYMGWEKEGLLRVVDGRVEWKMETEGTLVMRRAVEDGKEWREVLAGGGKGSGDEIDWRVVLLRSECSGARDARQIR